MDLTWSHNLYKLSLSVSGEQELDKLVKKAASAFLRKLDCTLVSVLQNKNNCLETAYVAPQTTLKSPAYDELIGEFEKKLLQNGDKNIIILKKGLNCWQYEYTYHRPDPSNAHILFLW